MNKTIETLCQLFREHLEIPVFENDLPEGFNSECLVIQGNIVDLNLFMNTFYIDVYVPNKKRFLYEYIDESYPDIYRLDFLEKEVLLSLKSYYGLNYNFKTHVRKYLKYQNMHYLNFNIKITLSN